MVPSYLKRQMNKIVLLNKLTVHWAKITLQGLIMFTTTLILKLTMLNNIRLISLTLWEENIL